MEKAGLTDPHSNSISSDLPPWLGPAVEAWCPRLPGTSLRADTPGAPREAVGGRRTGVNLHKDALGLDLRLLPFQLSALRRVGILGFRKPSTFMATWNIKA